MSLSSSKRKEIHENGVVRGKTARACDNCVKKRARWYCGADDAFLCHPCDASVHSANSLALRHHRLPLKPSSHKPPLPTWHRKPRTPRNHSSNRHHASSRAVPELCGDDHDDVARVDEHLLYRVPIFDPLVSELCTTTTTTSNDDHNIKSYDINYDSNGIGCSPKEEQMVVVVVSPSSDENSMQVGLLPTEMDLAEFAADVESLLGRGLEEECDFGMEGLGFVDFNDNELSCSDGRVKIELDQLHEEQQDQEEVKTMDVNMKMWSEPFELNMEDYEEESEEEDNSKASKLSSTQAKTEPELLLEEDGEKGKWSKKTKTKKKKKKVLLSLDYEGVITAWASQGSPWTTGARPDFDPDRDTCWPADTMGTYSTQFPYHHHYVDLSGVVGGTTPAILLDGGREARVLRYREKRRTRLFEKKIRYEVRKLNAEKRPRMKGRFVKRASFGGSSFPMLK